MGKHFVIACGGTGGHLFPGIAVAEILKERGHEVLLLVSEKEIDAIALKNRSDFRVEKLPSIGMPSLFSPAFLRFLKRGWESFSYCKALHQSYCSHAVLGMGGFTSVAPLLAARFLGIKTYLHESNAIAGKANKLAASFVNKIFLGFQRCETSFSSPKSVVTGTPVRRHLQNRLSKEELLKKFHFSSDKKTILIMGGSQGATPLNQLIFKAAPLLKNLPLQIIHLTGEQDDSLAAINYQREGIPFFVASFYHHMDELYTMADLVVSRAGAASLTEISSFGLPSILIPFPYAKDRHQDRNADLFYEVGAAEVLEEKLIDTEALVRLISNLIEDETRRERMSKASKALFVEQAAERIATLLEE